MYMLQLPLSRSALLGVNFWHNSVLQNSCLSTQTGKACLELFLSQVISEKGL